MTIYRQIVPKWTRWSIPMALALAAAACGDPQTVTADRISPAAQVATTEPTTTPAEPTTVPTPAPTPTATPIPTPTPEPIIERTLLFSGDVLSHTPVIGQARAYGAGDWPYDYRPMFADSSGRIAAADLAICVLETPISIDNTNLTGYPTFNAPRELVDALVDAGYDGCSTASNHSMDRGPTGVRNTLDEMDRVQLGHAGMARSEAEALMPTIYDVDGIAVAHLSWTYGLNGFVLPSDEPWLVNVNEAAAIIEEAQRASSAGADIVVLSIQWGNEYQRDPSAEQIALAEELTASWAIDLIIGNHVHVVQPVDIINGVPVAYGVGNSLSNQSDNCCRTGTQDGVMIEATVSGTRSSGFVVVDLAFAPTWVDRTNYTIIDLIAALGDDELDDVSRAIYQTSFDRTAEAIGLLDVIVQVAD